MAEQTVREQLVEALERLAPFPMIVMDNRGRCRFCGANRPKVSTTYEAHNEDCAWVEARLALDRARAEPEGHGPSCCYEETRADCPCYQEGLAQREPAGRGTP